MGLLTQISFAHICRVALRRWPARFLGLALLCALAPTASAQAEASDEYKVKAAFLFNFAQFVEWPASAFRAADAPLVIGILGEDPFGAYLDELVSGEKIENRPLIVRRFKRAEDIAECHILFISGSETGELEKIVARLKGRSLLTVSDMDTFTRRGGMVRFFMEEGKIRLRINVDRAKANGLIISSKILRPATVVTDEKE